MIRRLSHATIFVYDQEEAFLFYRDKLGFQATERPYGIEAVFRDNSGNWFSLTQPKESQ